MHRTFQNVKTKPEQDDSFTWGATLTANTDSPMVSF
jgi:hypothetical protein